MIRHILFYLLALSMFCSCHESSSAPGVPDEDEVLPDEPVAEVRRTVLIYCAAQNSLGYSSRYYQSNWTADSLELVAGKHFVSADDRLLVFVDDAYHPRLYRFSAEADPELILQWGYDANSSNPETLKDVLLRVKERFPAQEYGLTMWSHADGWIPSSNTNYSTAMPLSFGIDVGEGGNMYNDQTAGGKEVGAQMNIDAMAEAIKQAGMHFEYIFFDACLMQCVEVGYELRDVTDYIVASPISIASAGAYYTHMLERGLFSNNPCDLAQTYYEDVTSEELVKDYDGFGIVISVLKTSELPVLAKVVGEALKDVDFATYPDLSGAHAYNVYTYTYYYRPHYYDMRSALRTLLSDEAFASIDTVLSRAIVFYAATHKYWVGPSLSAYNNIDALACCGLSMFFPQKAYADNASRCIYGNHNQTYTSTAWARAIGKGVE
jgi:hypothetical protein